MDETIDNVKYPICPINLYFEGDNIKEDKCDWDIDTRQCTEACCIGSKTGDNL